MSNSGRKMSMPGWCTYTLLGGVLVLAFGAFVNADEQDNSKASLTAATKKATASSLAGNTKVDTAKLKIAQSKHFNSAPQSASDLASAADGRRTAQGVDCGIIQLPNQSNGLFADTNCAGCPSGTQIIADNFVMAEDGSVDAIRFWGGYFPENILEDDCFTVIFQADAGGAPGAIINQSGPCLTATSRVATGVVLFGVDEYEYVIDLVPNKDLAAGTYWVEVFNNTVQNSEWFWEVGNLDPVNGIIGSAFAFEFPVVTWNLDPATDLAFEIICKQGTCGADGCEEGENECNCPADCGEGSCGDGTCCAADGEDCDTCEADCGVCSFCGDGTCDPDEDCANCEEDCGACMGCDACYSNCDDTTPPGAPCVDMGADDWISNVTFAGINNTTGTEGCPCSYGDHTDIATEVVAGQTYDLTVSVCSDGQWDQFIRAWFDWNGNLEYECDESVFLGNGIDPTLTAPVTVPAGTAPGCYTMRVIDQWQTDPGCEGSCPNAIYGETEDYTVCVGLPCNDDGNCDDGETCDCVNDNCGECFCGNDTCDQGEDCASCPEDCGDCPPECGDGNCDPDEDECNCQQDCPGECLDPNQCPADSLYSQPAHGLKDAWLFGVSDVAFPAIRWESYPVVDGPICDVHWWAGELDGANGFVNCQPNAGDMEIIFYPDAAGLPDLANPACTYLLTPTRTETGDVYPAAGGDIPINNIEYSVDLPVCCSLASGWVSIQSQSAADCGIWWLTSGTGDGSSLLDTGGGFITEAFDLSLCLTPAECNDDGTCDQGENSCNCPNDCGDCVGECISGACCGDGVVEGHEECDYGDEGCGICPWDTFGGGPGLDEPDGDVGAPDLAFLLGNWGPVPPNAEQRVVCTDTFGGGPGLDEPDGDIGAPDLANLLGHWGPCPVGAGEDQCDEGDCLDICECVGRGACCGLKGGAGCDEGLTAAECTALEGGNYAGDDSTCDDCPDPACFDAEGDCCEAHGGIGCDDAACCETVCESDPLCCNPDVGWDEVCVDIVVALCEGGCPNPGDNCSDRLPIFDGLTAFDTSGANTDGLPVPAGQCNDFGETQVHHDIWFNYIASCDGLLLVTTCEDEGGSALYDSDLAMYSTGSADCNDIPCPPDNDLLIACNDDDASQPCGTVDFHSTMRNVPVSAGTCYKIRVGGWSDADQGVGGLLIDCAQETDCGDGACEGDEDACNCPLDCGAGSCGDGICCDADSEDCDNCPEDCGDCPFCGDGNCDPGEDCENCVGDCGICNCGISQPPNQLNGLFSDIQCTGCGGGQQTIAGNFVHGGVGTLVSLRWWGGYFPQNIPQEPDCFTINFRADAAGAPGAIVSTYGPCIAADSRVDTGIDLFGVDEYVYDLAINEALLPAGTVWVEIHNNTTASDEWFWETGNLDPVGGIPGLYFAFEIPAVAWNPDGVTEVAFEITCE